jgi:hypothetical protein
VSDFAFKISLPGYDVKTATPEQCAVHSSYPSPKAKLDQTPPHVGLLVVDFTGTVTQGVTHIVYAIDHGYEYTPLTMPSLVFREHAGQVFSGVGQIGVGATLLIRARCTASQFIVDVYDNFNWTGSNAHLEVSFHIFAENGA